MASDSSPGRQTFRSLENRSILVTGGSSGIGRAMSVAFAAEGAKVTIADVRPDPRSGGQPTHELIRSQGFDASFTKTDVSKAAEVDKAVEEALGWSGRLDVVVTSAVRVGDHSKSLLQTSEADWDAMMDVNLKGVFLCCKRSVQEMVRQEPFGEIRGRIITMASTMGLIGTKGHVAYCAGKGGVVNLTRQMAVELAEAGILVNSIVPGKIPTFPLEEAEGDKDDEEYIAIRTPYPRFGRPEEIAGLAVFLASDQCQYMTGAIIPVDGGWLAA
jgi:glucose 1-dehydrogenase